MRKYLNTKLIPGIIIGILLPIITIFTYYYIEYYPKNIEILISLFKTEDIIIKILSLAVIFNLIPFYIYMQKQKYSQAYGVIFATIAYTITIYIIKFSI